MKTPDKRNGNIMLINSSLYFKYASGHICTYMSIRTHISMHTRTHIQTAHVSWGRGAWWCRYICRRLPAVGCAGGASFLALQSNVHHFSF